MSRKYRIGIGLAVIFSVLCLNAAYRVEYEYLEKKEEQKAELRRKEEAITAQGEADKAKEQQAENARSEVYYLTEKDGYLVVYLSDQKTVYEYTSIRISELPVEVQQEIKGGKVMESTEKLYGFLENYSS